MQIQAFDAKIVTDQFLQEAQIDPRRFLDHDEKALGQFVAREAFIEQAGDAHMRSCVGEGRVGQRVEDVRFRINLVGLAEDIGRKAVLPGGVLRMAIFLSRNDSTRCTFAGVALAQELNQFPARPVPLYENRFFRAEIHE